MCDFFDISLKIKKFIMAQFEWELPNTEVSDVMFVYESTESGSEYELEGFNIESEYQDRLEFVKHQIKNVQNAVSKNNEALTQAIEDTESL